MEEKFKKIQELVNKNYKSYACDWSYERSEGNFADCFHDGCVYGESWLAYEIGQILEMELEEPDYEEE